jgi:predicted amidohydrolase YtcJ
MKKLAGSKARPIDLGGRTVIPGLTADHIHGNVYRAVDAQLLDDAGNATETRA